VATGAAGLYPGLVYRKQFPVAATLGPKGIAAAVVEVAIAAAAVKGIPCKFLNRVLAAIGVPRPEVVALTQAA
jgi:hypothetical protein